MATLDSSFGSAPVWLAAFAALVAVIGWETDWGRRMTPSHEIPAATAQPVAVALLPEYAIDGGVGSRRETIERPAFVPTRRPAPPPASTTEPPKPKLQRGQFLLTGTAVVDNTAIAFLREASTGKSRTVRKGDTINGMTVTEVVPDRVTLAMGDESEGLALKVATGPKTTVQPVTVAPPPGQPPVPGMAPVPAGAPTPAPTGTAAAAQVQDNAAAQSLLERRRAARAAQAAAEAARGNAPGAPAGSDTWADVYKRMQQPRQ
jgi:hypothetical protein